jgi:hypothetical protein
MRRHSEEEREKRDGILLLNAASDYCINVLFSNSHALFDFTATALQFSGLAAQTARAVWFIKWRKGKPYASSSR